MHAQHGVVAMRAVRRRPAKHLKRISAGNAKLVGAGAAEVARDGRRYGRGLVQGQVVQVHRWCGALSPLHGGSRVAPGHHRLNYSKSPT